MKHIRSMTVAKADIMDFIGDNPLIAIIAVLGAAFGLLGGKS